MIFNKEESANKLAIEFEKYNIQFTLTKESSPRRKKKSMYLLNYFYQNNNIFAFEKRTLLFSNSYLFV